MQDPVVFWNLMIESAVGDSTPLEISPLPALLSERRRLVRSIAVYQRADRCPIGAVTVLKKAIHIVPKPTTIKPNLYNENKRHKVYIEMSLCELEGETTARPKAKELTERELEVMHIFWDRGESTAADIRDVLAGQGRDLAYTTVATLIRILLEKEFLTQTTTERPAVSICPRQNLRRCLRQFAGRHGSESLRWIADERVVAIA